MAKYLVLVTRDTTESTEVVVDAPEGTPVREITAAALEHVQCGAPCSWSDDGCPGEAYLGDPDTADEPTNGVDPKADCTVEPHQGAQRGEG